MRPPRRVGRRFPDYGWAWPEGALDQLLKAVLLADQDRALGLALDWLAAHDLDAVDFGKHRLLAALADRFGRQLSASPAYPRLVGLQRMLWTRSRLALRAADSVFGTLSAARIEVMFLKGASRLALEPGAQRGRVAHDIDIMLRRQDMRRAIAILLDDGWQAADGRGRLRLEFEAERLRGLNFLKGEFGDLDLHSQAYHAGQFHAGDDEALWARSLPAQLGAFPGRVPAACDRIALAIAHSALNAHRHSDWLVDIAHWLERDPVDWTALLATLSDRRILVPAASALSYLAQETGRPIPPDALGKLLELADRQGIGKRVALVECKAQRPLPVLTELMRGVVKELRLARDRRTLRQGRSDWWRSRSSPADAAGEGALTEVALPLSLPGTLRIELAFTAVIPKGRRLVEWELSSPARHLAVLRYRAGRHAAGARRLRFSGVVTLLPGETSLTLTARPGAAHRPATPRAIVAANAPVPVADLRTTTTQG